MLLASLGFQAAGFLGLAATASLLWPRELLQGRPVAAVAIGVALSLLCSAHVTIKDYMLAALPIVFIARRWPTVALLEAVAVSAAEVIQLQLPSGDRHLQPLVIAVIAASTVLALLAPPGAPSTVASYLQDLRVRPGRELRPSAPKTL